MAVDRLPPAELIDLLNNYTVCYYRRTPPEKTNEFKDNPGFGVIKKTKPDQVIIDDRIMFCSFCFKQADLGRDLSYWGVFRGFPEGCTIRWDACSERHCTGALIELIQLRAKDSRMAPEQVQIPTLYTLAFLVILYYDQKVTIKERRARLESNPDLLEVFDKVSFTLPSQT